MHMFVQGMHWTKALLVSAESQCHHRSMASTFVAPKDTHDPEVSMKPRGALPVHCKEGGGIVLVAGRSVGVAGCVCSKLPNVYSH